MADAVGRVHGLFSAVANRISGHGSPLRRTLSPIYGRALSALSRDRGIGITINGETFRIDPRFRSVFPEVYEPELLELMRGRLGGGDCVVDVGANLGIWVMHAARIVGPRGRVIGFEPNPATSATLRRHIKMNGLEGRVTIETVALASRSGTARLFGAAPGAGTSRLDGANPEAGAAHIEVDVPVATLDEYCRRMGVRPRLILIDVEGFEGEVLEGGHRTIAANPAATVVIEMHPTLWPAGGLERMRAVLDALGREVKGISNQEDPLATYGQVVLEPVRSTTMAENFPVTKTEEEWRAQLTPEQFAVLRQHATERPGSCALLQEKRAGTFTCVGCGQPLFVATRKFESGTGWPSFFDPIDGAVGTTVDRSHFMVRTEVHCSRCGGHLGHVFEDGPPPTGLRYCINGVALEFEPA